jgi:Protein of unknown function (DUF3037)
LTSDAILSWIGYHTSASMPRPLQFFTICYAPNVVAGKGINIGVVLFDPEGGFCGVRFVKDWRQVRGIDPDADIEMLEALGRDIESQFRRGKGEEILKTMEDSFSNAIQLSPATIHLVHDPAKEIEKLASQYLGECIDI